MSQSIWPNPQRRRPFLKETSNETDCFRSGCSYGTGWSYREILPYFRKSEHNENFGPSVYHGRGGPFGINALLWPFSRGAP